MDDFLGKLMGFLFQKTGFFSGFLAKVCSQGVCPPVLTESFSSLVNKLSTKTNCVCTLLSNEHPQSIKVTMNKEKFFSMAFIIVLTKNASKLPLFFQCPSINQIKDVTILAQFQDSF